MCLIPANRDVFSSAWNYKLYINRYSSSISYFFCNRTHKSGERIRMRWVFCICSKESMTNVRLMLRFILLICNRVFLTRLLQWCYSVWINLRFPPPNKLEFCEIKIFLSEHLQFVISLFVLSERSSLAFKQLENFKFLQIA